MGLVRVRTRNACAGSRWHSGLRARDNGPVLGGRLRFAGSVRWGLGLIAAACLLVPATAPADLVRLGDIDVTQLASAVNHSPVQPAGQPAPTLTPAERHALAAQISKKDRGRIWIAVVTPVNPQ